MTAVMRSMPAVAGPQVLRIGLVQEGKIVDERVIDRRSHVTIGPSEKSMFVVANDSVPPNFRLFEVIDGEYHLNFLDGMSGRVALQTGITDLAELRGQAKRSAHGAYQVRVTEDARGKVVVGETTFLFQLFDPPTIQPKPQLPVSVKTGLRVDWPTTIIAAFSFLAHFGMVGAVYSDWMDSVIDDDVTVTGLVDSVKSLPTPPAIEQPVDVAPPTEKPPPTAEAPKAPSPEGGRGEGPSKSRSMNPGERARLSAQLDQLAIANLGVLNGRGPATDNVLRDGSVPTDSLDAAAEAGSGVSRSGWNDLNLGRGGGDVIVPGAGSGGLQGIGSTKATTRGAGEIAVVKPPEGNTTLGPTEIRGGHVIDAERVVAQLRARFRICYSRGLATNPTLHGSVKITARIGPNGEVLSATPSGGEGLGEEVVTCLVNKVMGANFRPPEGGGASIVIPITLALQK
jgi:hypothetical protein